jgi:hypothetical protein
MSTLKNSGPSAVRVSLGLRRLVAPLVLAAAFGATSAYAADSRVVVARAAQAKKSVPAASAQPQSVDAGLDGVLVAPGCPSCSQQSKPASFLDWVRAQIERLAA